MLIGQEGEKYGLIDLKDALSKAQQSELDLVQVSPATSNPIVCKLMDYFHLGPCRTLASLYLLSKPKFLFCVKKLMKIY